MPYSIQHKFLAGEVALRGAQHLIQIIMPKHDDIPKAESWRMFNEISSRYDFLNHFLSFGLDFYWRRRMADFLPQSSHQKILDLATGTADVLLTIFKHNRDVEAGYGIDMAEKMLDIGRAKIARFGLQSRIILKYGNAGNIPFPEENFDVITMAFGIRNVENPSKVLEEMFRVLKKNGRVLILEFSLPHNPFIRWMHLIYLRHCVPVIGGIFSGNYQAYRYLSTTIEKFPYGKDFRRLMEDRGFQNVKGRPLLWGVATIYIGDKAKAD